MAEQEKAQYGRTGESPVWQNRRKPSMAEQEKALCEWTVQILAWQNRTKPSVMCGRTGQSPTWQKAQYHVWQNKTKSDMTKEEKASMALLVEEEKADLPFCLIIFYLSATPDKDHGSNAFVFLIVLYVLSYRWVHFSRAVLFCLSVCFQSTARLCESHRGHRDEDSLQWERGRCAGLSYWNGTCCLLCVCVCLFVCVWWCVVVWMGGGCFCVCVSVGGGGCQCVCVLEGGQCVCVCACSVYEWGGMGAMFAWVLWEGWLGGSECLPVS